MLTKKWFCSSERVLQTVSRFMARQGRPPQWNYEEKRNVWSLATSRMHYPQRCKESWRTEADLKRTVWFQLTFA
ncbi:hypothetical protein T12_9911 [Trichinella patagoniensis]|uniref:Uncharacterized protein n=1 Tax=Trichinella patagoniensis TaxID=990121 RepID=A0A0V0YVZ8_9BILA|nr:hypothetical protein T12_6930 [Trichinella patagoniensis]KRY04843.1 hypothetical protein T12_9911 [Trichinella patagoniensis]